jgi:hypothetical protein
MGEWGSESLVSHCRLTSLFLVRKIFGFDKRKLWQLSLISCLYLLWTPGCCFVILSGNTIFQIFFLVFVNCDRVIWMTKFSCPQKKKSSWITLVLCYVQCWFTSTSTWMLGVSIRSFICMFAWCGGRSIWLPLSARK